MKKIISCLLCLLVICGCSASNRADDVKSIELSIIDQDYYKNEEIEVTIKVNNNYQLTEDDFVLFGGSITVKDKTTAILTFQSAGKFHVYAKVNDVTSNELVVNVVSSASAISKRQDTEDTTNTEETTTNPPNIPDSGKDLSDLMTLYEADESELANADEVAANIKDYNGYSFAMQGTMPEDGDGSYLLTNDGHQIPLSGLSVDRTGPTRVYGTMYSGTFDVAVYSIVE